MENGCFDEKVTTQLTNGQVDKQTGCFGYCFISPPGIKNLIFVNRFENHQLMVFLLLFLIFFGLFSHFENWQRWTVSIGLLGAGLSFFFLFLK